MESTALRNDVVFPPLLWTALPCKTFNPPRFTNSDPAGEVILAEDSPSATQRIERAPKHACGRMSDFASSIKSDDEPISVTHMAC